MTQEDKNLLLKDLCGRLPYGVKCVFRSKDECIPSTILRVDVENELVMFANRPDMQKDKSSSYLNLIEHIKPYLRPLSSMTDEEENEWRGLNIDPLLEAVVEPHTRIEDLILRAKSQYGPIDWLNAHHFDYRNLIEKGLALEAPEGMYKNE